MIGQFIVVLKITEWNGFLLTGNQSQQSTHARQAAVYDSLL